MSIVGSIRSPIVGRIAGSVTDMPGGGRPYSLLWGGTNEYGKLITPWSMSGYGDWIEFEFTAASITGGNQYLIASDGGKTRLYINTSDQLTLAYTDVNDTLRFINSGATLISAGVKYSGRVLFNADGVVLELGEESFTRSEVPAIDPALSHVSTYSTPQAYFNGTIHKLDFYNATPMQDVELIQPDGTIYGELDTPIVIPAGDDFEIKVNLERHDRTGTDAMGLLGGPGSYANGILIRDSGHGSLPNSVALYGDPSGASITNVFENVAQGQKCELFLTRIDGDLAAEVDGVSVGNSPAFASAITIDKVLAMNATPANVAADGPLMNLEIRNTTENLRWFYSCEKDATDATLLKNLDPGTGSTYDGEWKNADASDFKLMPVLNQSPRFDKPSEVYARDLLHPVGGDLWSTPDVVGDGWTDNGDGTYSCDGTQAGYSVMELSNVSLDVAAILYATVANRTAGTVALRFSGVSQSAYHAGDDDYSLLAKHDGFTSVGFVADPDFIGDIVMPKIIPITHGAELFNVSLEDFVK